MAQKYCYRSRASYTLLEVSDKSRTMRPGMAVIDFGAALAVPMWSVGGARRQGAVGRLGHPAGGRRRRRHFHPWRIYRRRGTRADPRGDRRAAGGPCDFRHGPHYEGSTLSRPISRAPYSCASWRWICQAGCCIRAAISCSGSSRAGASTLTARRSASCSTRRRCASRVHRAAIRTSNTCSPGASAAPRLLHEHAVEVKPGYNPLCQQSGGCSKL